MKKISREKIRKIVEAVYLPEKPDMELVFILNHINSIKKKVEEVYGEIKKEKDISNIIELIYDLSRHLKGSSYSLEVNADKLEKRK